jgi:MFS family permease
MNQTGAENFSEKKAFHVDDRKLLLIIALAWLVVLTAISMATSWQYGFHRDELNFIENARHLDWGYVEYPPLSPLLGRLVLELFGISIVALRFTSSLAICLSMYLTGMMALEMGGSRAASITAAMATGLSAITIFSAFFFSYQTFDFLFWVLISYFVVKLLNNQDGRWWLPIGAAIGLGMQNKYTLPFFVVGIAGGLLLTPERKWLKTKWLWLGAALAVVIFIPNLIWQINHHFVSLEHQADMRNYNIEVGRTADFLISQFYISTNPAAVPLWMFGLYFALFSKNGVKYRVLGWMFLIPLGLFMAAAGRFYYMAPVYPMLIALGAARLINRPGSEQTARTRIWKNVQYGGLALLGLAMMVMMIPFTPPGSPLWRINYEVNPEIGEQIGWPEQVKEISRLYNALPEAERAETGIMAMNYGEASAIQIYGPELGLPEVISGENTFWYRGYGEHPPQKLIVVGLEARYIHYIFTSCKVIGHVPNPYGIENQELRETPDILFCEGLIEPWEQFWSHFRHYG